MRRILIFLALIVLIPSLGCATHARKTLVFSAEGQAVSHTVCKPDLSGIDASGTAGAVLRAHYEISWD